MKNKIEADNLKEIFTYDSIVRVGDLNYGNHLAHDKLITIIHDCRVSFLSNQNMSEINIEEDLGLIISELNIKYKKEAFLGEKLIIKIFITDIRAASFEMQYIVENKMKEELAICKTSIICISIIKRKIKKIPEKLLKILT